MSQTKAQLVASVGIVTATAMTVTGVLTATTVDGTSFTGAASSITQGKNLNVGVVTSLGIAGDITGSATSITQGTNVTFGSLTASRLVGNLTGNAVGNALGDAFSASVSGVTTSNNISVGVVTATSFVGDGTNVSYIPIAQVTAQTVTANSATTTIDLSAGNLITFNQSADTTVSLANTSNGYVYIVRVKDNSDTARTITWPTGIGWSGGSEPTLDTDPNSTDIIKLVTRDEGVTWDAKLAYNADKSYELWIWGNDKDGIGGVNEGWPWGGHQGKRSSPIQVGTDNNWKEVASGTNSSGGMNLALRSDGTMWITGNNASGQLGLNDQTQYSSPTQIPGDWSWKSASRHTKGAVVIKGDGSLWSWGYGAYGALGLNQGSSSSPSPYSRSSPCQIGADTDWASLGKARTSGCQFAIKTDGSLWTWGRCNNGRTGRNDNVDLSSPTQVGSDTTWKELSGGNCSIAVKTNGTLWGWGVNQSGNLGLNAAGPSAARSSPTQIGTDATWSTASASNNSTFAIKTDGSLWSWGTGGYKGILGHNQGVPNPAPDKISLSSPTQIGTDTTWSKLAHGHNNTVFAIKTDGTGWAWGGNDYGQFGSYTNPWPSSARSSPVQLPGTNWHQVEWESYTAWGLR